MEGSYKKPDVEWNKDGRDWPLQKRTMLRYLVCYDVKDDEWQLDDICDQSVQFQKTVGEEEEKRFTRQDFLLAKLIASSLSCTLARHVMKYDYGSEMWDYLCKRFEGRENDTTKLYMQRTLRQKLETASCRPGSDVEKHLLYMMGLREQLAALDADVGDIWMVDLMIRSMSQLSYYSQLQTMMLMGGVQTLSTPDQAKSLILVLDKNATVEKQLQARRSTEVQSQSGTRNGGDCRGGGRGKPMPKYQNHTHYKPSGENGSNPKSSGTYKRSTDEEQRQHEDDRKNRNCYGEEGADSSDGNGNSNIRNQANFTVSSRVTSHGQQGPAQKQGGRDRSQDTAPAKESKTKCNVKPVYRPEQWVFDNGATQHLAGDKRYFVTYRDLTVEGREMETVHGYNGKSSPVGIGSIDLWVKKQEGLVVLRVDNVYYSPNKTNLFSQSAATEQGFQIAYDDATREYTLSMNGEVALEIKAQPCKLWTFTAENEFLWGKKSQEPPTPQKMVNYAIGDGVADLQCWHERLGHICPQFVKQMADQSLVEGMMLRNRKFDLCEACQLGKQRAKTPQKNVDRGVERRNQLVFADLLFPPSHYNCTRFKAILVIMDAHTRFLTAYPVQTKDKDEINPLMRRYIIWAERQWPDCKVKEVLTDGGGEFLNDIMTTWYQTHGITHTTIPKNTSRLNMVERTHQTLTGMMKFMIKEAGFPTSFWVEALHYAAYLKNRSFTSATNCTPYQCMWGRRPDIHHVRKFGALAYVHIKVGPSRHKFADNCRIGFVLGYRDGLLGCKVYFPNEGTVQVAGQVTVNEQILYKNRHNDGFDDKEGEDGNVINRNSPGSMLPQQDGGQSDEGSPWLQRPSPTFSDDVALHPEITRINNVSRIRQQDVLRGKEVNTPKNESNQDTVDSSVNEDPEYGDENKGSERESKTQHRGLITIAEHDGGEIGLEEMQVYAALSAIATITEEPKPQQRIWHESEVRVPRTVSQAMASPQRAEWWKGMEKDLKEMEEKDVIELVPENEMPEGTKVLETMWRFQTKTDEFGNILRYRPRLCGRGDKEVSGIDFNVQDTFSPVARMASFRVLVALCKILQLLAFQCDINTAYLNARRKVVRYIRRIAGFPQKPGWVYKVKNALYGLYESGREWYDELHGWLTTKGLQRSSTEPCLYYYFEDKTIALVLVYVDDVICATNSERWNTQFFGDLNDKYGIKDLGRLNNYLGVQVNWQEDGVLLHQTKYAQEILERFGFTDAIGCRSPMDTTIKLRAATEGDKVPGLPYREIIGALMYLATSTRPDIAFPVGYLSRFVRHPNVEHAGALKRVLRYLAATANHGVFFKNQMCANVDKLE